MYSAKFNTNTLLTRNLLERCKLQNQIEYISKYSYLSQVKNILGDFSLLSLAMAVEIYKN